MTDPHSHSSRWDDARQLIVEAAFHRMRGASLRDILSFLGPKALAEAARELVLEEQRANVRAPSPETVALHFRRPDTQRVFNLDELAEELLLQACAQIVEAAEDAVVGYLEAADAVAASGDLAEVARAMAKDLAQYQPGSVDPLIDARERLYFTAVALCDDESAVAKKLRKTMERVADGWVPVYKRFLEVSRRRMVQGYEERDLAVLVSMLLDGETLRYRFSGNLDFEKVFAAVIRLFWAFTAPIDGDDPDVVGELTRDLPKGT
jgi:hypothetical protein